MDCRINVVQSRPRQARLYALVCKLVEEVFLIPDVRNRRERAQQIDPAKELASWDKSLRLVLRLILRIFVLFDGCRPSR
jgi:hypothetical protein